MKPAKPHKYLSVSARIHLQEFEICVDATGDVTEILYEVSIFPDEEAFDPSHAVRVGREDFLAMLTLAQVGQANRRSSDEDA